MADKFKEIGAILAAARREKNKSLKEAEESTKIMAHYLEAIEAGEAEKLPTREYFMLFARGYAQYLGVDPSIFESIEFSPAPEKEIPAPSGRMILEEPEPEGEEPEEQARKFGKTLLYIIVGIVVVFAAFFVYIQWFAGAAEKAAEPGLAGSREAVAGSARNTAAAPLITIPDQPYKPPEKLDLRMVAKQNVWTVVVRDGDTVTNRELEAGQQRQWQADYRFVLTLGVSNGVDLYINGRKLPPLTSRARTISGVEINQANYEKFFNPPDDTSSAMTASPIQTSRPKPPPVEEESWIEKRQPPDTAVKTQPVQETAPAETPPPVDTGGVDEN